MKRGTVVRALAWLACSAMVGSTTGCHSAFIDAMVINHTGGVVKLLEVDYPSASFGTQDLAVGSAYRYHFKIIGQGATKVTWTDAAEKDHTANGPELAEGEQGKLTITLEPQTAQWQVAVKPN